jgi:hypothetical protein
LTLLRAFADDLNRELVPEQDFKIGEPRQVELRLVNEAVRIWAPEALRLKGRAAEAEALRALEPIADLRTAKTAHEAISKVEGIDVEFARSALHCVCLDAQGLHMGAEIGARSALAAKAWADCYTDSAKRAEIYGQIPPAR